MSENLVEEDENIVDHVEQGAPKADPVPESLKSIFQSKHLLSDTSKENPSIFNKTRGLDQTTTTTNIEEVSLQKAEEIYKKLNIFNKIPANAKSIAPLNNSKLQKKDRQKQKELTAGKGWGEMPKVELTDEIKADLRAIKLRNFIYPKRFYKSNDSKKLPQYFQIGEIVDDKSAAPHERFTKKQRKGRIADQFMRDDEANMFSKKKYENVNDKLRRMGDKKQKLKINKHKHRTANKFKNKGQK